MVESSVLSVLQSANTDYKYAVKANINIAAKKQTLINILFSHADELINAALEAEDLLKKKIERDKEIAKLKKRIDELTACESDAIESETQSSKKKNG